MTLQLAYVREVACWTWEHRDMAGEPVFATTCATCARDVAQPVESRGERPVCFYCGLESGLLEPVEIAIGDPLPYADGRHLRRKAP